MNYSVKCSKRNSKEHQDWFDENDYEILSLLDERRRTHDARNRKQRYA